MKTSHTLNVSREGILKSIENQFSDRYSFFRELLQNARRAGSEKIEVFFDTTSKLMVIRDYGVGLDDQGRAALYNLGQSGWNGDVVREENPFGLGIASALVAARKVLIASQGIENQILTDDLFQENLTEDSPMSCFAESLDTHFPVETLSIQKRFSLADLCESPDSGTLIGLQLDPIKYQHLDIATLESQVEGFPIPVIFNGIPARRHDAPAETFVDLGLGRMNGIDPLRNVKVNLYLQGFAVGTIGGSFHSSDAIVIHLDSTQFTAKAPDRNTLVDFEFEQNRIRGALLRYRKSYLEAKYASMDEDDFVLQFSNDVQEYHSEMWQKLPVKTSNLNVFSDLPWQDADTTEFLGCFPSSLLVIRPEDLKGWSYVNYIDDILYEEPGLASFLPHLPIIEPVFATSRHWLSEVLEEVEIDNLRDEVSINVIGEGSTGVFHLPMAKNDIRITICDAFELTWQGRTFGIQTLPVYDPDRECWYITKQCTWYESMLKQHTDYRDNDEDYLSTASLEDVERDNHFLTQRIELLKGYSPVEFLQQQLNTLNEIIPHLENQTFTVYVEDSSFKVCAA